MKKWQLADNFFRLRMHRAKPANEEAAGFRMNTARVDDIMIAREKHSAVAEKKSATEGDICFSAIINEKAFDEVKQEVRKHGLSSLYNIMYANARRTEFALRNT